jgi:hypothetical protein
MLEGMRRDSDVREGGRTGVGRRARDRLLTGDVQDLPDAVPAAARGEIGNLMLFVSDDLRQAGLAVGGLEAFLLAVQQYLDADEPTPAALEALLGGCDTDAHLQQLDDTLYALRRSMLALYARLDRA